MKRLVKAWALPMVVLTALAACQKEKEAPASSQVEFSIGECSFEEEADPETRTVFARPNNHSYPTLWSGGEEVFVFYQARSGGSGSQKCTAKTTDHVTARLAPALNVPSTAHTIFFMMISPAGAVTSPASSSSITVSVPTEQTPTATSPDEAAMILAARTSTYSNTPFLVNFSPKHMTAYMNLALKNTSTIGRVLSVTVTASVPLSGSATFDVSTPPSTAAAASGISKSVTAVTANLQSLDNVWLACLPAQVAGTTLTIKASGRSRSLTRTITVPAGKNLLPGKIALLSVDMNPTVAVTGVTVSPTTLTLEAGETSTLTATVTPSNATDKSVTWSSSNPSVATVSSTGVVTGVAAGSATITATTNDGGKKATCAVTVTAANVPVTGVSLDKTTLSLGVGSTSTLTATVTPSNATDKSVTWASSNTSIATVSSTGVVRGVKAGSATITVKTNDGNYTAKCTVTVTKVPTRVEINRDDFRFDLDDGKYHMSVGVTTGLTYTVYYSDGTTDESSNGVASVVSGSGISISQPSYIEIRCTQAGQEAVLRVAAKNNASVYDEIRVRTWEPATSIEFTSNDVFDGWVKTGSYAFLEAVVKPSTARQKVLVRSQSNDSWGILQLTDLRLRLKAPTIEDKAENASQFRSNNLTLSVTTGAGDLVVTKTFSVTNLDLKEPKPLDYICYNSSSQRFKILDGGMRLYWPSAPAGAVYAKTPTLSVPSGYSVVGIVTKNYSQGLPPGTTYGGSRAYVEKVDGTTMAYSTFHGFAIALHNASEGIKWSTDHDDVDRNENWRSEIGKTQWADSQMYNAFGLTIAAYYYNYCRGSSHDIQPIFAIQDYWTRYPVYTYHMVIPAIDWGADFDSWVMPTTTNFSPLLSASGTLSGSEMLTLFNARIQAAGGTTIVADDLGYWTIQTTANADNAYIYWANGRDIRNKAGTSRVRPFLIF